MHDSTTCPVCLRLEARRLANVARQWGPCGCCEMARPNPSQGRNALIGLVVVLVFGLTLLSVIGIRSI